MTSSMISLIPMLVILLLKTLSYSFTTPSIKYYSCMSKSKTSCPFKIFYHSNNNTSFDHFGSFSLLFGLQLLRLLIPSGRVKSTWLSIFVFNWNILSWLLIFPPWTFFMCVIKVCFPFKVLLEPSPSYIFSIATKIAQNR